MKLVETARKVQRRGCAGLRSSLCWTAGLLTLLLVFHGATGVRAKETETSSSLFVAFSAGMFSVTNKSDAKAAIKVWADTLATAQGIQVTAQTEIYDDLSILRKAIREGRADLVSLRIDEYLGISADGTLDPYFVGARGGTITEEFLLVAHKELEFRSLGDLRNKSLTVLDSARTGMSSVWLDSLLLENGYPTSTDFFRDVSRAFKISRALLPVFFRQRDVCLITSSGYKTMCELNPQVGSKVAVIGRSTAIVPSLMCIRRDYNSAQRDNVIQALLELHQHQRGRQVLLIFGMDKLVRCSESDLAAGEQLLRKLQQLKKVHTTEAPASALSTPRSRSSSGIARKEPQKGSG